MTQTNSFEIRFFYIFTPKRSIHNMDKEFYLESNELPDNVHLNITIYNYLVKCIHLCLV